MVVGSIFGIGITKFVYYIIGGLLSALKINFHIIDYMPDGIDSSLSVGSIDTMLVKAILAAVAYIVVFLAANYIVVRKRDVK
jgi:hypothetical protein